MPLVQLDPTSTTLTQVPVDQVSILIGGTNPAAWDPSRSLTLSYNPSGTTARTGEEVPNWDKESPRSLALDDVSLMYRGQHLPGSPITVVAITQPQSYNETTEESEMFSEDEQGITLTFTPSFPEDVTSTLLKLAQETSAPGCDLSVGEVDGTWRMSNFPGSNNPNEVEEAGGSAYFYGRTETPPST